MTQEPLAAPTEGLPSPPQEWVCQGDLVHTAGITSQAYLDAVPGQAVAGGALVWHGPRRGRPLVSRHWMLHRLVEPPACPMRPGFLMQAPTGQILGLQHCTICIHKRRKRLDEEASH